MPAIKKSRLELDSDYLVIKPLKKDGDVVKAEKKYDRHSFGEVIAGGNDLITQEIEDETDCTCCMIYKSACDGDIVVYNDSEALEIPLDMENGEPSITAEIVPKKSVAAIEHITNNNTRE